MGQALAFVAIVFVAGGLCVGSACAAAAEGRRQEMIIRWGRLARQLGKR